MSIKINEADRGRRVLVTGASSGIGREIARVLGEHGFALVVTARRRERLEALADELRSAGGTDVVCLPCDLASPDGPTKLHEGVAALGLDVDILINNAGTGDASPFHEADWSFHERCIQLMALSPSQLIHLFLPGMLARRYGRIANVTSVAAYMPGIPMHGFYCPTKSFLYKLTESLATEYAGTGVTFTATVPGFTESEMIDSSGARPIVEQLPGFMFSDTRTVAEQTVAACLAGMGTYTHTWFNRVFFGGLLRHFPARHAHKLMLSERDRARRQHAGDGQAAAGLPGVPVRRKRDRVV
jgi:short-subunit dehydrogenase